MIARFELTRLAACGLLLAPTAVCAGMTLPLITTALLGPLGEPRAIAQVYAVNTLGAIVGALAGGLWLLPALGIAGLLGAGAALDLGLGIALAATQWARRGGAPQARAGALALALVGIGGLARVPAVAIDPIALGAGAFRHGRATLLEGDRILSWVDGRTATVAVVERGSARRYRILFTNGKPDASVAVERWPQGRTLAQGPVIAPDEPNQWLLGLIPLLLRPSAERVAMIGLGSGISAHVLLGSPRLETLRVIEIEPEIVTAARLFAPHNRRITDDSRLELQLADARVALATDPTRWDLIISEPSNPWVAGVANLYTVEHYRRVRARLAPAGLFVQWIHAYELADARLLAVLAAIDRAFQDYLVVRIGVRDYLIAASPRGPVPTWDPTALAWASGAEARALLGISSLEQIAALAVADASALRPFLREIEPITDDHSALERFGEHDRLARRGAEVLQALRELPLPPIAKGSSFDPRVYPAAGLADLRDPHVFREPELANAYRRLALDAGASVAPAHSLERWTRWRWIQLELCADRSLAGQWLAAVTTLWAEITPWGSVHSAAWWHQVRQAAAECSLGPSVEAALDLLEALDRADDVTRLRRARFAVERDARALLPPAILNFALATELALEPPSCRELARTLDELRARPFPGSPAERLAWRIVLTRLGERCRGS